MLVKQGNSRTLGTDRQLACSLAAVAGALNAAAFYAVGFFSANMTGNVSILSDHLAVGHWLPGAFYVSIIGFFIAGAVVSTLLINIGHARNLTAIYALCVLLEGLMLIPVGFAHSWLPQTWHIPFVVLSLAFIMGHQNAIVTRISDARVRTTHVSGMATDIGIELGLLLGRGHGADSAQERSQVRSRLRLHSETILSFLAGGIAGVLIYQRLLGGLFIIAAGVLIGLAAVSMYRARQSSTGNTDTEAHDL